LEPSNSLQTSFASGSQLARAASAFLRIGAEVGRHAVAGFLAVFIVYLSLVATSAPMSAKEAEPLARAIDLLEVKGFDREVFLLRHVATFRSRDNWINSSFPTENSFAATNFPFGVITLYEDFFDKAADDTTRAMILLHETQHLQGADETAAYSYVWQNRERLGWTQLSPGMTETYVAVELDTREHVPELFTCNSNLWNDCTNRLTARK